MHVSRIQSVAIVGAGITAAALAERLSQHGIDVDLYEKARGAGGRLTTRRAGAALFNHGCPTSAIVKAGRTGADGLETPIHSALQGQSSSDTSTSTFLAANSVVKNLVAARRVRYESSVARIEKHGNLWRLLASSGEVLGSAAAVVLTLPVPQALQLMPDTMAEWQQALAPVQYSACWTAMFCTPEPPTPDPAIISRLTRGHIDPDAELAGCSAWVAHATPEFSQAHLEHSADQVLPLMIDACGLQLKQTRLTQTHRWRYAICLEPISVSALWDAKHSIGIAGDAFGTHDNSLERALRSAQACAQRMLNTYSGDCGA